MLVALDFPKDLPEKMNVYLYGEAMDWLIPALVLIAWACFNWMNSKGSSSALTEAEVLEVDKALFPVQVGDSLSELVTANFVSGAPVLFTDIDGVFHRNQNESFERLGEIRALCKAIPHLQLVLSSSWRHDSDERYLKGKLKDLYPRVVGATPILSAQAYRRQKEVITFCKYHQVETFLVIDDTSTFFEPGWDKLYLTDKSKGFTLSDIDEVARYFSCETRR